MTIGYNEIELLREQMIDTITRTHPGCDLSPDANFIKYAVLQATYGWMAYRVRARGDDDDTVEERWQIRSQWTEVKGSDVDAGNRVERHPDVP